MAREPLFEIIDGKGYSYSEFLTECERLGMTKAAIDAGEAVIAMSDPETSSRILACLVYIAMAQHMSIQPTHSTDLHLPRLAN